MTCGECVHYRKHVNPKTGRVCPAQKGYCGWEFPKIEFPEWVRFFHSGRERWPSDRRSLACPAFQAKDAKPAQAAPKQIDVEL